MSILSKAISWTETIHELNGIHEALKRLEEAVGPSETAAAASQLIINWVNKQTYGGKVYDWTHVDPLTNTATTAARNWAPGHDPLVLDLDGGGITTSGINPNAPIFFDQDGDGTLTATGWIAAGEAIVVRDLNGNGTIDSGQELFGAIARRIGSRSDAPASSRSECRRV